MDILCDKTKLLDGINIALKAISGKSTMAILECIVLEVKDDIIKIIANDLELGIETVIEGKINDTGSVAINAKVFFEIIRKLPVDEVHIFTGENDIMNIHAGKAKFSISTKSTEEFPFLPTIVKDHKITISQFRLKEIIRQTVFSISDNENTKIATGELFEIQKNQLKVVALDGHRIAIRNIWLAQDYEDVSVIIPGKTLIEISKILSGDLEDEVTIYFTEKHVLFEMEHTIVLSRLIEGEYYDVNKMMSGDYETRITVSKKEIFECIDRTTLLIKESEKKPVLLDIKDDSMGFSVQTSIGSMHEEIEVKKEGKDILIGFNPRFLIDALRVIDEEEITIYMINPKAPCFIRDKEESYIYLILPVNIYV